MDILQVYRVITAILETIECNGSRECNKGNIREIGSNVNTNKKVLEFGKIEANPLPTPLRFSSRLWISSDLKIHKSGHSTLKYIISFNFTSVVKEYFVPVKNSSQKYLQMCIQFDTSPYLNCLLRREGTIKNPVENAEAICKIAFKTCFIFSGYVLYRAFAK